jgi:GNAT superfamily N-acetyltransferase
MFGDGERVHLKHIRAAQALAADDPRCGCEAVRLKRERPGGPVDHTFSQSGHWLEQHMSGERVGLRRAIFGDEPILRALRLQALSDAPDAFGSTYERELARTTSDWQQWLSPGVTFILDESDGANGIVAGVRDAIDPAVVHLMAMWVHPAIRGLGAGDALVDAVLSWAEAEGAKVVRLDVVQGNDRARRFYERNGFRPTGHEVVRERDGRIEVQMERLVDFVAQE